MKKFGKLSLKKIAGKASKGKRGGVDCIMRYILIIALIVLFGYTLYYIFTINKVSRETFLESEELNGKINVIYIYSDSCRYCTLFTPIFDSFAAQIQPNPRVSVSKFEKSNPEVKQLVATAVTAFPTVVITDDKGKIINTSVGSSSLESLNNLVQNTLSTL
jgi:thiol-disulfide isomerase/thioredoxin